MFINILLCVLVMYFFIYKALLIYLIPLPRECTWAKSRWLPWKRSRRVTLHTGLYTELVYPWCCESVETLTGTEEDTSKKTQDILYHTIWIWKCTSVDSISRQCCSTCGAAVSDRSQFRRNLQTRSSL